MRARPGPIVQSRNAVRRYDWARGRRSRRPGHADGLVEGGVTVVHEVVRSPHLRPKNPTGRVHPEGEPDRFRIRSVPSEERHLPHRYAVEGGAPTTEASPQAGTTSRRRTAPAPAASTPVRSTEPSATCVCTATYRATANREARRSATSVATSDAAPRTRTCCESRRTSRRLGTTAAPHPGAGRR